MTARVTYLLGAGASVNDEYSGPNHQIIPTVKFLYNSMSYLSDQIGGVAEKESQKKFGEQLKLLANKASSHATIDTYARMLAHIGHDEQYSHLKTVFSLYLCVLQRLYPVGKRYDAFLAALLEKNENGLLKLPDHIRVLSWNYDAQFELAAANYVATEKKRFRDIQQLIDSFPKLGNSSTDLPSLIHLNGVAGLYEKGNEIIDLYGTGKKELIEVLNEIDFIHKDLGWGITFENLLSFSWEKNNPYTKKALEFAQEIALNTEILVVIGYSFPFFNRQTDRTIWGKAMGGLAKLHKIYYQDPMLDGSFLRKQFNIPSPGYPTIGGPIPIQIEHIPEVNQFFIPHEL